MIPAEQIRFSTPWKMVLVVLAIGCACTGWKVTLNAATSSPNPDTRATVQPAFEIVDAAGRTVRLQGQPRRIVIVGRAPFMILHLLYMFPEAPARLVGFEQRGQPTSFVKIIDRDLGLKVIMKPNPGPEQIASLKPDVVLIKGSDEEPTGRALKRIGIPVVYLGLEDPLRFFKDVENMGKLLGNPGRAADIARFYRSRLDMLHKRLAGIPEAKKPTVLVIAYHERSGVSAVKVPAASWMQTIQVREAGGHPVWTDALKETDGWSVVNFEQIALWNPEKIFVVCWYTFDPSQVIATLRQDNQWSKLKAVKSGAISAIPTDLFGWDNPEPRWILGLTWMAAHIWPERFPEYSVAGEIEAFFKQLYGLDTTTINTTIMPHVRPKS